LISPPLEDQALRSLGDQGPVAPGEGKVFEKLFRGTASDNSGQRGAGLGLAIARAIIVAHGGRIWAANRPEGGALFSFALPLGESPPDITAMEERGTET
jgi:two-component system sensor histidine kinase KdpD